RARRAPHGGRPVPPRVDSHPRRRARAPPDPERRRDARPRRGYGQTVKPQVVVWPLTVSDASYVDPANSGVRGRITAWWRWPSGSLPPVGANTQCSTGAPLRVRELLLTFGVVTNCARIGRPVGTV